ncbi:MAG: ribonuclease HII [Anaerolineae bacterium CG03_land_8_20_14_0_80_58_20]|nr:MAG: ribonuclease HII [Anaerolineae bacterium CG03_land_8_20_14_0_80_58_20]
MIVSPDLRLEKRLWRSGLENIAGMDEAGRGALAGPVTVGAVILPNVPRLSSTLRQAQGGALSGVRDSKQMTPPQRARWAAILRKIARAWSLGWASADEIDSLGISAATRLASERALAALPLLPNHLLTDFRLNPDTDIPLTSLVKGDQKSLSIASASVLAKTARDAVMCELDEQYPGYGLARHKGYGTIVHREAIERLGHSPIHRKTFAFR